MTAAPNSVLSASSILSYPGTMEHAQQVALALHEVLRLNLYVTTFAFCEQRSLGRLLGSGLLPGGHRVLRQLRRRAITAIPANKVKTYPGWELLRTAAQRGGASAVVVDRIWDKMAREFDELVARRHLPGTTSIHAFEYTALHTFEAAQRAGARRVLHLPSLDSRHFEAVRQREYAAWPELAGRDDTYFQGKFNARQDRRCQEIELADLIVANSSLTAKSHIQAGADPSKVMAVPLGAPPVPDHIANITFDASTPLRVLWAGSFKLGKGAHYFLQAWKSLNAGPHASTRIYGSVEMPEHLISDASRLAFMGSVPQAKLHEAFEQADVLVFPSLCDGFGSVVTEALSRGLPVVVTDQAGAADFIEHESNGLLIPAGDATALRNALQWCLDNRVKLFEMRELAAATARRYQWSDYRIAMRKALGISAPETHSHES